MANSFFLSLLVVFLAALMFVPQHFAVDAIRFTLPPGLIRHAPEVIQHAPHLIHPPHSPPHRHF